MYRPRAFVMDDRAVLLAVMREHPFATIAAVKDGAVQFAYAPMMVDEDGLRFHLARANPVAGLADGAALAITFRGPDAYISPDWYVTEHLVPTWNYIAVEARGVARKQTRDELRTLLNDLSAEHETPLAPKRPWTMDKLPAQRADAMMNAIVGFAVNFESVLGKFKLSQNRSAEDISSVIAALEARGDARSLAIARAMREYAKA